MRALADVWSASAIVQAPLAQLPWYHHIALLTSLDRPGSRLQYAERAVENGWSRNVLQHHVATRMLERTGNAVTNFPVTLPPANSDLAQQATRDPYLFDFVGNADLRHERDLEKALVDHVSSFSLELGHGFAYVGRQVRLEIDGQDFYCDLLFYHLRLRAYVVVELKVTDVEPGYLGQLGLYMAAVDDVLAHPPGSTHHRVAVQAEEQRRRRVCLRGYQAPIGIAEWTTAITTSLPEELSGSLTTIKELEADLAGPNSSE